MMRVNIIMADLGLDTETAAAQVRVLAEMV